MKKRGLGRGLDALLGSVGGNAPPPNDATETLRELALDSLAPGRHQPRRIFEPEALQSLADSIKAQGVVQPIVARQIGDDRFEIVAGERRWRAARMAGLTHISAVVRTMHDQAAMAVALVENIQRADLNPLEEAEALKRLIDEVGLTHEQTAEAVGRSRAAITNLLRLMDLAPEVQVLLRENKLSSGHAKVLLGVSADRQIALVQQVVAQQLSVRQTEALVALAIESPKDKAKQRKELSAEEQALVERIGLSVRLTRSKSGAGKLVIEFGSSDDFQRLMARLG